MKEILIRFFFEGRVSAEDLAAEASRAFELRTDSNGTRFAHMRAIPMRTEFDVSPRHMLMLLDAFEAGRVDPDALDAICFCLEASDSFVWDADTEAGSRVAETLFLMGSPEINYPLTLPVLEKIRHLLLTGEQTFTPADRAPRTVRPHLLSEKSWERVQDV